MISVLSVFTLTASAASTSAYSNLSSSRYAKVYTLNRSGRTIPYTSKYLSTRGSVTYGRSSSAYIDNAYDELYLFSVGVTNNKYWAYVSYPIGSRRANAYIPLSSITNNNGSHVKKNSTGKFYCSYRSGVSTSSKYYVDKGDSVYLLNTSGNQCQILYPISGNKWRIGFCSKSDYDRYCNPGIAVTSIRLKYSYFTLKGKGSTVNLIPVVYPLYATNKSLTWTSSNPSVATVNSAGKVTSVGAGTTRITATAVNGVKASATIKVTSVLSTRVTLNSSNFTLYGSGSSKTLKATAYPYNSTDRITWRSSNSSIATVDQSGKVTAVNNGSATIIATTTSGRRASVRVTCANCNTYSISNNVLTIKGVKINEYKIGSKYTSSRYVYINGKYVDMYGWQCCGYARYIQYKLYGSHYKLNNKKFPNLAGSVNVYPNATGFKNLITAAGVGAHIRTRANKNGVAHSMIVINVTPSGFTITDANSDNKNTVEVRTYTWNEYAQSTYGKRGLAYIEVYRP